MIPVQLDKVSYRFGDLWGLEEITLDIEQGEFLAVLGANGAGKSTLLKIIAGTIKPASGRATVLGKPAGALGPLTRKVGYLPQAGKINPHFPISAEQVVMMGQLAEIGRGRPVRKNHREKTRRALERVDAADLAHRPIGELSGGQKQRVFLARALVNEPELLLLDEPMAAVDTASLERLYELFRDLHAQGTTIVLVSHDIGVVTSFVDRVACLNRRLVAHGKPDAVLGDKALEEMYGCHAVFFDHGDSPHMVVKKHAG